MVKDMLWKREDIITFGAFSLREAILWIYYDELNSGKKSNTYLF
jgi:hypothetical protein